MNKEYRLIHFNCARPFGEFNFDNEFVRVFMAILPRIFTDADQFEGLRWHSHGVRRPDAEWRGMNDALPHPEGMGMPDICTMAVWTGIEALKEFTYSGRTHPPGMRRLATQLDRSQGASFVLWWAPRSQILLALVSLLPQMVLVITHCTQITFSLYSCQSANSIHTYNKQIGSSTLGSD